VEVGVGDGVKYSFSKFFEDALKWKSLLIEANPQIFQELQENRPDSNKLHGAFCEGSHLHYSDGSFSSLNGSVEISSELHSPVKSGQNYTDVPCLQMDRVFSERGITKVDIMVVRLQGDALAFIQAMDWTVRVDIWVILMHGATRPERDNVVRHVLNRNEYVQAEWDIKRWCEENGLCLNNEIFLRKGFNPLPCDIQEALNQVRSIPQRRLRGDPSRRRRQL